MSPESDQPPLDLDDLMTLVDNDGEFAHSLITDFLALAQEQLASLQELVAENDLREAGKLAHSLKGGASTVRATPVSEAAANVESAIRDQVGGELDAALASLRERMDALTAWVDECADDLLHTAQ